MVVCIDITEMINVNFISGIQRVVKQILTSWIEDDKADIRLLKYDFKNSYFQIIDNDMFYAFYTGQNIDKKAILTNKYMKIDEFNENMLFFDMDSVWMNFCKRSWLLPLLKRRRVKIAALIYDIIPITESQYCHEFTTLNFMEYLGAHLKYSDLIIANTQATIDSIYKIISGTDVKAIKSAVVPLGSDFQGEKIEELEVQEDVRRIVNKGKYILMVGTLEPRKNHKYVLEAFEKSLFDEKINLVFAGRVGWNIEQFMNDVYCHEKFNIQLFHVNNATDMDIEYLYNNAFLVAFPSFNEGFGLPIIEAYERMTPVLAADIPVLREVGGDYCDYVDLKDVESFIEKVKEYLQDTKSYLAVKGKLKNFQMTSWKEVAENMLQICSGLL